MDMTTLGPRQRAAVDKAFQELRWEANTFTELRGTIGAPETERRTTLTNLFGPGRPELAVALAELEVEWPTVTPANYRAAIDAIGAKTAGLAETRPVVDERETAEERADIDARTADRLAEERARSDAAEASWAVIDAKAPAGAAAVIVATEHQDTSDPMSDYFGSRDIRHVAIGWRYGSREDFKQLRAAAATFGPTAHLDDKAAEHRDNYSMGAGNYLGTNPNWGSGWSVRSVNLAGSGRRYWLLEDGTPETSTPAAMSSSPDGVTVSPGRRAGVVEIRFPAKPSPEIRSALKRAGFRWAKSTACWYGPAGRVPPALGIDPEVIVAAVPTPGAIAGAALDRVTVPDPDPFGIDRLAEEHETRLAGD